MGNLPMNALPPGLLTHPAGASLALDQQKGGEIVGMVVEKHETAGTQERHHLAAGLGMVGC